jgi:hypothetical protein
VTIIRIAISQASAVISPYGPSRWRISSASNTLAAIAIGIRFIAVVTRSTWV